MKIKKVLIAEHDPGNTELLIEELNVIDTRTEIIIKKYGFEVMDYFQQPDTDTKAEKELQIDLIIVDLNLPDTHGIEVLRYLKNDTRHRSIPVIIFSKNFDTNTISEVYENGGDDFIKIPSSFNEFSGNIKKLRKYLLKSDTR